MTRIYRISHLPDPSMTKYRGRYGDRADEAAASVLARCAELLSPDGSWLGLRYLVDPSSPRPETRLALLFRVATPHEEAERFPGDHHVNPFFDLVPATPDDAYGPIGPRPALLRVTQAEELVEGENGCWAYAPVPFTADPRGREERALALDTLFDGLTRALVLDLLVRPTTPGRALATALITELQALGLQATGFVPERRERGTLEELARRRDPVAARHAKHLERALDLVLSAEAYEFAIRIAASDRAEAWLAARTIGTILTAPAAYAVREATPGDPRYEQLLDETRAFTFGDQSFDWDGVPCYSDVLNDDALSARARRDRARAERAARLSRLRTLCDAETMRTMLALPVANGRHPRCIALETEVGAFDLALHGKTVVLGTDLDRGRRVGLALDQLVKHVVVLGGSGAGKSTTVRALVYQLYEEHGVPVLILESAKGDYRSLLRAGTRWRHDLRLFTVGNEDVSPLRFNPLEVPPRCSVEEHIGGLVACFQGAMPLDGPLGSILLAALTTTYDEAGIEEWRHGEEYDEFPTLDQVMANLAKDMDARGYAGEVKSNVQAAIETRLEPLCRLNIGRLFRAPRSLPSLAELIRRPAVLELQSLNPEQKSLVMLFFLTALYRLVRDQGQTQELRLVLVVEEAHNLVGAPRPGAPLPGVADPQGHATRLIVNLLAEIRAYGVAMIFVDQSPASIAPEVLKNTTTKVGHRINDRDDRETVASAITLDQRLEADLTRLGPGEIYFYNGRLYEPLRLKVDPPPFPDQHLNDEALHDCLRSREWYRELTAERVAHETDALIGQLRAHLASQVRLARTEQGLGRAAHEQLLRTIRTTRAKIDQRLNHLERATNQSRSSRAYSAQQRSNLASLLRAASQALPTNTTRRPRCAT